MLKYAAMILDLTFKLALTCCNVINLERYLQISYNGWQGEKLEKKELHCKYIWMHW